MNVSPSATAPATVLESVRQLVADDAERDYAQRQARVMLRVTAQKRSRDIDQRPTDAEDNWLLLINAIDRGDL